MMITAEKTKSSRAQLWVVLSVVFFGYLCLSIPYLVFPSLFLKSSSTILPQEWSQVTRGLFLGITLAAYPLGQFIGSPITGALSDEHGRRKIVITCLLISAFCSFITALSLVWGIIWLLIASRFCAGLVEGSLALARAMAADSSELCKQNTFGKISAAACFAYIIGPPIGALLSTNSPAAPFFMISLVCITNATISYFTVTNHPLLTKSTIEPFLQRIHFIARMRRLFKNPQLKLMLLSVSLHTLAEDVFYELSPTFLISKWSLGSSSLAVYNSTLCMSLAIGGGFTAGHLAKRFPRRKVLTWSMLLFAACLLSVLIIPSPAPVLGVFAIIGFAIAIPATNLTVQVSNSVSDDIQGEVMGVQSSLRVLGSAIICFFGSILISLSPSLIMLVAALISLSSLVYYLKGIRSPKLVKRPKAIESP